MNLPRLRAVEDALHATAQPLRRGAFALPDRCEDREHVWRGDLVAMWVSFAPSFVSGARHCCSWIGLRHEVARRVDISRPAVWRWQRRYGEEGVDGPPCLPAVAACLVAATYRAR